MTAPARPGSLSYLEGLGKPLLIGLAIRELIAPFTGHPFDFEIWVRLGVFIQSGASPYSLLPNVPNLSFAPYPFITSISYLPFSAFIFGATYWLYQAVGSPTPFLYYFLLKQPMVIADVLVALLLYKLIALRGEPGTARKVAHLWLFFPFSIIVSSMWGALDPVVLLLLLASLYTWQRGRPSLSAGLLGLSIYLKLMPIIFVPLFLLTSDLSMPKKGVFAAVSLGIPLIGTLVPSLLLGWGFSGISSAVSYQGSLPSFGGLGIFDALSFLGRHDGLVATALSWTWLPATGVAYAYALVRKQGPTESMLVTVLAFSIFRPTMPEQWAVYPVALLLLAWNGENRVHVFALAAAATAFLVTNNLFLVRFFAPVAPGAFAWDRFVDNSSQFADLRYALLLVFSTFFTAEAFSVLLQRHSFLASKLGALRRLRFRDARLPLVYLGIVSVAGGLLDYTATKMVTDWGLAIQSNVFLGLSWLSLYHIMLVLVFETMVIVAVIFSNRDTRSSLSLLLLLTFLNIAASTISLMIYRGLNGDPVISSTTIYLASSVYVTERAFVVFALTLSALGLFYLNEVRAALLLTLRAIAQISSRAHPRPANANSLPAPS